MFVPEAAIYKYYCPIFRKDYIRTPRRCSNIFSVTKTFREIYFLLFLLLFCISASDVRHIFTANITRMIISHFYRPQPIFDLFKLLCKTFCDCFSPADTAYPLYRRKQSCQETSADARLLLRLPLGSAPDESTWTYEH